MKIDDITDTLRELFFEFLGFLVPGASLLFLTSTFIRSDWYVVNSYFHSHPSWEAVVVIIAAYSFGHAIYGIALSRDKILNKLSAIIETPQKIEAEIEATKEFEETKKIIESKWGINFSGKRLMHDVRNAAMSYVPEVDNKIYKSKFRSELCNNLGVLAFFFPLVALFAISIEKLFHAKAVFLSTPEAILCYIALMISSIFFRKTRMRFLRIAYSIPFSIFMAKIKP
jgi:hypothetical protein